jgi:hypothetical protein
MDQETSFPEHQGSGIPLGQPPDESVNGNRVDSVRPDSNEGIVIERRVVRTTRRLRPDGTSEWLTEEVRVTQRVRPGHEPDSSWLLGGAVPYAALPEAETAETDTDGATWEEAQSDAPRIRADRTSSGTPIMPEDFLTGVLPPLSAGFGEDATDEIDAYLGAFGIRASRDLTASGRIDWPAMATRNAGIVRREVRKQAKQMRRRLPGPTTRKRAVADLRLHFHSQPRWRQIVMSLGLMLVVLAMLLSLAFPVLFLFHALPGQRTVGSSPTTNTSCCNVNATTTLGANSTSTSSAGCCTGYPGSNTPSPGSGPTVVPATPPPGAITATSAVISFVPASQKETSNGAMTACANGCTLGIKSTSGNKSGSHTQSTTGWNTQASGYVTVNCNCISSGPAWYDLHGSAGDCGSYYINPSYGNSVTVSCVLEGITYVAPGGISGCDANVCWNNGNAFANTSYRIVTFSDCHGAMNTAYSNAAASANTAINGALSGLIVASRSINPNGNAWSCNPGIGGAGNNVTGGAAAMYSGWGFSSGDAQSVADSRLNALLPSGYYWSSSPTPCTPSYTVNGSTANITCADSDTAIADWRASSSAGQAAWSSLSRALLGAALSAALSYCNGASGVASGSCHITLSPGNASILPSNTSAFSLTLL